MSIQGGQDRFQVRKLEISDKSKGFLELLQQLTVCNLLSDEEFTARFREISSYGEDHVICVIEDSQSNKIVATGSVFLEKKFLRNCGNVGHIEDVVVDSGSRGMKLGQKVLEFLTSHAKATGCYKVILDCSADNKGFYEKCGFKQKEIQMAIFQLFTIPRSKWRVVALHLIQFGAGILHHGMRFLAHILAHIFASIVAGSVVWNISLLRIASGNTKGGAPGARLSIYKVRVSASVGKSGLPSSACNAAPWILADAASSVDREFTSILHLGNSKMLNVIMIAKASLN